jgi:hypothetical protein
MIQIIWIILTLAEIVWYKGYSILPTYEQALIITKFCFWFTKFYFLQSKFAGRMKRNRLEILIVCDKMCKYIDYLHSELNNISNTRCTNTSHRIFRLNDYV